ncbi:MAG: hypothetical protein CVV14_10540 [Gammaproteobacteria bacterium HGW-Gammaproteobacteria-4]|nr:MAG: hypothetical protein CVV14_10540 [Gammaproteobacteria bacterium HGW-Gammaproteobacteria-4]
MPCGPVRAVKPGLGMASLRGLRRSDLAPWARIRRVLATLVQASGITFVGSTATRLEPTYDSGLGIQLLRSSGRCAAYAFATFGRDIGRSQGELLQTSGSAHL